MTINQPHARPHSEEYFGDERDFYWNRDFLALIAQRLRLRSVRSAADIGCGVGHWSELLYPHLAPGAALTGIDREPEHLARCRERLRKSAVTPEMIDCREAEAERLPLASDHYDLATCQTLLLHLAEPRAALQEMVRITRPGGLVLCVEPNNLVARLPFSSLEAAETPDPLLRLSELAWRHAIGRQRRGLGAEFIGEQLPGLFRQVGLDAVQVWLSDKATAFIPPYESPGEQAELRAMERWRADEVGPFDREEMRRNVLAGGGTEAFFTQAWSDFLDAERIAAVSRAEQRWHTAGGVLFFIVAGRKPD